jgi:phospholipid/cholesterol/gamma-HCH transport system substrate-binding protein
VSDLLARLDTFLNGLDAQKADIVHAIDAVDRLSAHLSQDRATIADALDALDPGLSVLAAQREQLTAALNALSNLSSVGTRVITASRQDTADTLKSLRPILDQLNRAGDDLPKSVDFLLTYPFPPNVVAAISGNSVRLHATLDLDGAAILANLLASPAGTEPGQPASSGGSTGPVPPLPGLPVPVPSLPPAPGLPLPIPSILPSASPSGLCGLLGPITGCK